MFWGGFVYAWMRSENMCITPEVVYPDSTIYLSSGRVFYSYTNYSTVKSKPHVHLLI